MEGYPIHNECLLYDLALQKLEKATTYDEWKDAVDRIVYLANTDNPLNYRDNARNIRYCRDAATEKIREMKNSMNSNAADNKYAYLEQKVKEMKHQRAKNAGVSNKNINALLLARNDGMQTSVKNTYNSRNTRAAASAKLQDINPDMVFDFSYKQRYNITTPAGNRIGRITGFNMDKNVIIMDNKHIAFDDVIGIRPFSMKDQEQNTASSLSGLIRSCMNGDFNKCFAEEYKKHVELHGLSYDIYKQAMDSFGEIKNMNKADKRKLIFAIKTIADNYNNKQKPKVPQSLKELADEYDSFWLWFGGKRGTLRKAAYRFRVSRRRHRGRLEQDRRS
jgi:hypothetical protein